MTARQIKKISIITPCYNAENYIQETMASILNNTLIKSAKLKLQYIICDGGSKDKTLQLVQSTIDLYSEFNNLDIRIISEPDAGMYDALAKGLAIVDGDVCAYLNAGDMYSPKAFEVVVEMFAKEEVAWITGLQVIYNEKSHITNARLPFRFLPRLIQTGMYGSILPFIQQESTFWHSSLNVYLDLKQLASFRYAGDYFIWKSFCEVAQLYVVGAWLGGFKRHHGQLSEDLMAYAKECKEISDAPHIGDYFCAGLEGLFWLMPTKIKKRIAGKAMYLFDDKKQEYSNGDV